MSHVVASTFAQRGPMLIGAGLAIVFAAQLWPVVPIATAIMLIGCGATLTLLSRSRTGDGLLAWVNLVSYSLLVCLAIVGQADAVQGRVELPLLADHAAAAILLLVLARFLCRRVQAS